MLTPPHKPSDNLDHNRHQLRCHFVCHRNTFHRDTCPSRNFDSYSRDYLRTFLPKHMVGTHHHSQDHSHHHSGQNHCKSVFDKHHLCRLRLHSPNLNDTHSDRRSGPCSCLRNQCHFRLHFECHHRKRPLRKCHFDKPETDNPNLGHRVRLLRMQDRTRHSRRHSHHH